MNHFKNNLLFCIITGLYCFISCLGGVGLNMLIQGDRLVQNIGILLSCFLISALVFFGIALIVYKLVKKAGRWSF
jgi:ABC-type multidrug transport system permease subunit